MIGSSALKLGGIIPWASNSCYLAACHHLLLNTSRDALNGIVLGTAYPLISPDLYSSFSGWPRAVRTLHMGPDQL